MIVELISTLKQRGVTFAVGADGRLKVEPKSELTPDEIALLRQRRDALIAHLTGKATETAPRGAVAIDEQVAAPETRSEEPAAQQPTAPERAPQSELGGVAAVLRGLSRPSGRWGAGNSEAEAMQALWDAAHGL